MVAIVNFSKITYTLFLTLIFEFLRPRKIMKFMQAAILNFGKTLKKSHAHRGECDSKILLFYNLSFQVFATSKKIEIDPWRPF